MSNKSMRAPFRGFSGETLTLVIVDGDARHDHLEIWRDNKRLCYYHISEKFVHVLPNQRYCEGRVNLTLTLEGGHHV